VQHRCVGTLRRTAQLAPIVIRERPGLSLSHGSRPLVLLSSILAIPTVYLLTTSSRSRCRS